jgi:hypothetical protein
VLALGLAGGLLLVFVTPPFQVPDEPAHFFRAYQIATAAAAEPGPGGGLGFQLPASLPRLVDLCVAGVAFHPDRHLPPGLLPAAWRLPLEPRRRAFLPAGRLTSYTAVPYLAGAAAVAAGRLLVLPPLALLYLARLGNLAAALALSWIAVRLAPVQRWLIALLTLTPMAMFERSSASADGLTNALPLLLVSCLLSLTLRPLRASPRIGCAGGDPGAAAALAGRQPGEARAPARRAALLLATAFLVAAAKGVYFLIDLLVFLVPPAGRGRVQGRAIWKPRPAAEAPATATPLPDVGAARRDAAVLWAGGVAAAVAGAGISWGAAHRFAVLGSLRPGVQPQAQLRGALAAPWRFLGLAAADYLHHGLRYAAELVGNFGWLDTPLPHAATVLWGCLLLVAAWTGGDPALAIAAWQRWLAAAVMGAALLLLSLSQYVTWTPLGASFIDGLQGRYFLPLAPVAAILFYNRRFYNRRLAGRWTGSPGPAGGASDMAPAGPAAAGWLFGGLSVVFTVLTLLRIWFRYHGT